MRKRFAQEGLDGFEAHEILELLLFYCIPMKDTNVIAHRLINEFGGFAEVLEAEVAELMERGGVSEVTATFLSMISQVTRRYSQDKYRDKAKLSSSEQAGRYAVTLFEGRTEEVFFVILLNATNKIIKRVMVQEGTINQATVYPRKVVELALKFHAVNLIISHNHPGGSLMPSAADLSVTKKLKEVLKLVDVNLIDHIIVGGQDYYSMAEHGKM